MRSGLRGVTASSVRFRPIANDLADEHPVNMSRLQLEGIRWTLAGISLACIVAGWVLKPQGGVALGLFFVFLLFGVPAAMLTLHLRPPKFLKDPDR